MSKSIAQAPATSVILHDVRPECRLNYERWMAEATAAHQRFPGYLATDIIKPVESGSRFVVILRFEDAPSAQAWLVSAVRADLLAQAAQWLSTKDRYQVHDDAEFWFTPPRDGQETKRWKQWLLSTCAVWPLTIVLPQSVNGLGGIFAPWLPHFALEAVTAALISAVMVYWLMPVLSRVAASWLLK